MKLQLLSLLSPTWMHPAYIGAIAAACMSDVQSSEDVVREATFKLNGLKTAIQIYHKQRLQGGDSCCASGWSEAQSTEEVVCSLLRLCLAGSSSGSGSGGVLDEEDGLSRLMLREDARVALLGWVRSEMAPLLTRPAVAELILKLVRQTFGAPQPPAPSARGCGGTVSFAKIASSSAGAKLQAVVLGLANALSKYLHSFIGVEVDLSSSPSSTTVPCISASSLPLLLQSVSAALTPFAHNSFTDTRVSAGDAGAPHRKSSNEHEVLVKKVRNKNAPIFAVEKIQQFNIIILQCLCDFVCRWRARCWTD